MRVGTLLLPADPWPETVARVRRLEALGYDHLWTYDHLSWRRYHERPWHAALPWLTGVAGATERIGIGTMVSSPNFHHPVTFAKEAMTLDHVSNGRLTLGLGVGGTGYDATVFGTDALDPGPRVDRFVEFTALTDHLLQHPSTTFRGEHYRVVDAQMRPGCVQRPRIPFAMAAGNVRTLDLAARFGDAWVTYGDTSYADVTADGTRRIVKWQLGLLREACERYGRDVADMRRIYLIGNTEARPLQSVRAFVDFARTYAQLGFTDLVFHHPRPDDPIWNEPEEIVEQLAEHALDEIHAIEPTLR